MHAANGAVFGLAFHELRRRISVPPRRLAVAAALGEHAALYPLGYFVDRYHPRRGERGIPRLLANPRAFGQATFRHALFGAVLGRLAE
jgi:predicted nuclease with RNAse H fold